MVLCAILWFVDLCNVHGCLKDTVIELFLFFWSLFYCFYFIDFVRVICIFTYLYLCQLSGYRF